MTHCKHLPSESTDPQRRHFLRVAFGVVMGFFTLSFLWPFLSFLIGRQENQSEKFVRVPNFGTVPVGTPTKMTFEYVDEEAFIRRNEFYDIWVIKNSATDAVVYSPLCPHLSCRYSWNSTTSEFACPCHGSMFDEKGSRVAGPAPRSLDTLPHHIEGGELYVKWKVYKPGIPQKEEA